LAVWLYTFWALTSAAWVWLALAPLPPAAPGWLAATREVCFGTLDNGLPDVHGWIGLAAPVPMLIALLALMGRELKDQMLHLMRNRSGLALVLLLLTSPGLVIGYAAFRVAEAPRLASAPERGALPENYPRLQVPCPPFSLIDQDGHRFSQERLKGKMTLMTFAYAHCQTVCPGLLESLRRAAQSAPCRVVIVTLDPRRDTCGSLRGLAQYWELPAGSAMLGGEVNDIDKVTRAFQVITERNPATGEITHPALVFLCDRQGQLQYRFSDPSVDWLEEALRRMQAQ